MVVSFGYLDKILELWTKRNFRCDCGNSKFGEFFCKLFPNKDVENVENSYNHNFKGSYCTCGRPYPDPDVEEQVEMIQCCVCEDWFHEEHIGLASSDEVRFFSCLGLSVIFYCVGYPGGIMIFSPSIFNLPWVLTIQVKICGMIGHPLILSFTSL